LQELQADAGTILAAAGTSRLAFEKKLICELLKEPDTVVVLDKGFGAEEAANSQRITEQLMSEGHQVRHAASGCPEPIGFAHGILAVECTIGEISALISVSDEFIGYDSACQHIAAALAVPTITIFAGSNNPRFVQRWSACGDTACKIVLSGITRGNWPRGCERSCLFRWFVNACSDLPVADLYRGKVEEIMSMDQEHWNRVAPDVHRQDSEISKHLSEEGLSHYAIKYNPFMGVMSDYFLHED
jgi:hypothetical protein